MRRGSAQARTGDDGAVGSCVLRERAADWRRGKTPNVNVYALRRTRWCWSACGGFVEALWEYLCAAVPVGAASAAMSFGKLARCRGIAAEAAPTRSAKRLPPRCLKVCH